jgi:hypothetical protein
MPKRQSKKATKKACPPVSALARALVGAKEHPRKRERLPSHLKSPIVVELTGGFGLSVRTFTPDEVEQQFISKGIERLARLLEYYNLDSNNADKWFLLSWCLARELGWMEVAREPRKGPGRPHSWPIDKLLELKREVDAIKTERGRRTKDAVRILKARSSKTGSAKYKNLTVKTLVNRCSEAKAATKNTKNLFGLALLGSSGSAPGK